MYAIQLRAIAAVLAILATGAARADIYQLTAGWTDPTTYNPGDTPTYELRYRVAGGSETLVQGLTTPAATATATAAPGQPIEVAVRAVNGTLLGAWSPWATATAAYPPTMPAEQTGLTITIIRTGP
jgi:hypothetical protein